MHTCHLNVTQSQAVGFQHQNTVAIRAAHWHKQIKAHLLSSFTMTVAIEIIIMTCTQALRIILWILNVATAAMLFTNDLDLPELT